MELEYLLFGGLFCGSYIPEGCIHMTTNCVVVIAPFLYFLWCIRFNWFLKAFHMDIEFITGPNF